MVCVWLSIMVRIPPVPPGLCLAGGCGPGIWRAWLIRAPSGAHVLGVVPQWSSPVSADRDADPASRTPQARSDMRKSLPEPQFSVPRCVDRWCDLNHDNFAGVYLIFLGVVCVAPACWSARPAVAGDGPYPHRPYLMAISRDSRPRQGYPSWIGVIRHGSADGQPANLCPTGQGMPCSLKRSS